MNIFVLCHNYLWQFLVQAVAIFKQVKRVGRGFDLRERFASLKLADVTQVIHAESVLRAAAFAFYASGWFEDLFAILKNNRYSYRLQPLQNMWYEAHYKEAGRRLYRYETSALTMLRPGNV